MIPGMKKIVVDSYKHSSDWGTFSFDDVTVYVDNTKLNADTFLQKKHEFGLMDDQIARLEMGSVRDFLCENYWGMINGEVSFEHHYLRGLLIFLGLRPIELSKLTGISNTTC